MPNSNIFINKILIEAAKRKASRLHLTVGAYPVLRIDGDLVELETEPIVTNDFIKQLADLWLSENQKGLLEQEKEVIVVKDIENKFRLKITFFFQKGFLSTALAFIPLEIPLLVNLGLPKSVYSLAEKKSGLIVVAGPFGSGKSTTVASLVEAINQNDKKNILVVEQPIEYLFSNKNSLVEQREVGRDVNNFSDALEYARQADVDVVAIGVNEERDVVPLALDLAHSGRLVILTMNSSLAINVIDDIVASFPSEDKNRAQVLLAETLLAVIVQRLLPKVGSGQSLATELLLVTDPVRSLIQEGRFRQINSILQSSRAEGMMTLDQSLAGLVRSGEVLADQALDYASDQENFRAMIKA